MVIGGELMETSKPIINRALKHTDYYDWKFIFIINSSIYNLILKYIFIIS